MCTSSLPSNVHTYRSICTSRLSYKVSRPLHIYIYIYIYTYTYTQEIQEKHEHKQALLQGHAGAVCCTAVSRDSHYIVSGSSDKTMRIWNPMTGQELLMQKAHRGGVFSLDLSHAGNLLVTGGEEGTTKVWNVSVQEVTMTRAIKGHTKPVNAAKIAPDGLKIATGSSDGKVSIWNVQTGKRVQEFTCLGNNIYSVAWSSDSKYLAAGGKNATVLAWDATTGKRIMKHWRWDGETVRCVVFISQSHRLASAGEDCIITIWGTRQDIPVLAGGAVMHRMAGHTATVMSLAVSPDSTCIVSGSCDSSVRIWDTLTGTQMRKFDGHSAAVYSVSWSPDGIFVVSGGADKAMRVWSVYRSVTARQVCMLLSSLYACTYIFMVHTHATSCF
jgi:WD40 repeat protein